MSTPPTNEPADILEIHREIERLLSASPDFQLVGVGRNDPRFEYITIEVRHLPSVPVKTAAIKQ